MLEDKGVLLIAKLIEMVQPLGEEIVAQYRAKHIVYFGFCMIIAGTLSWLARWAWKTGCDNPAYDNNRKAARVLFGAIAAICGVHAYHAFWIGCVDLGRAVGPLPSMLGL